MFDGVDASDDVMMSIGAANIFAHITFHFSVETFLSFLQYTSSSGTLDYV